MYRKVFFSTSPDCIVLFITENQSDFKKPHDPDTCKALNISWINVIIPIHCRCCLNDNANNMCYYYRLHKKKKKKKKNFINPNRNTFEYKVWCFHSRKKIKNKTTIVHVT